MMRYAVDSGVLSGILELPDDSVVDTLVPDFGDSPLETGSIQHILERPSGGPPLSDFLHGRRRILLIVNDGMRPTPTAGVLGELLPLLSGKEVRVLIACGTHREPTEEEKRWILGETYDVLSPVLAYNDPRGGRFTDYGRTRRGTPVLFNRILEWADGMIPIGSVEPHYFAGLTGGRKSFLPGVAAFETIEANHYHAVTPGAETFRLEGNPVHEDMVEAVSFLDLDRIFSVQTVVDTEGRACFVSAGDIHGSFDAAVERAKANYGVPISRRYDLVVAGVPPPLSKTLYQSQKGLENAALARRRGGRVVLVTRCSEGVGDDTFVRLLKEGGTPERVLEMIRDDYKLGYQKAAKIARHAMEGEFFLLSELPDAVAGSVFATPVRSLSDAAAGLGSSAPLRVLLMPDAPMTVPLVS